MLYGIVARFWRVSHGRRYTYWFNHLNGEQSWHRPHEMFDWDEWWMRVDSSAANVPQQISNESVNRADGNAAMVVACDEACKILHREDCPSHMASRTHGIDLTDHVFKNGFNWRGWVKPRTFAKELEGYHGVDKFLVVVHPSAKNFDLEPKVYFVIRGLDGIEALVWKNSKLEDSFPGY